MSKKPTVLNIETYPNYTLYAFKKGDKVKTFELFGEDEKWSKKDKKKIKKWLENNLIITYNGMNYDIPMIDVSLNRGLSVGAMYALSDKIINNRQRNWMTYKQANLEPMDINHIDIMEPSPAVMISLKLYMARMGCKKLQDLPYEPGTLLTRKEADNVKDYCGNDLIGTEELYYNIKSRLDLREALGSKSNMDLRSKSDAQIAEALLIDAVGYVGKAPHLSGNYAVKYKAPKFLKFKTPELKQLLKDLQTFKFTLDKGGKPSLPKGFNSKITIGNTVYKIGMGGLHSQEKSLTIKGGMKNGDITSMYPSMIENQKLYPKHLSIKFLKKYTSIKKERVKAKDDMKKLEKNSAEYKALDDIQGGFKIQLNGSYGKFGSKYSKLYSPDLLLQTTLTGQLVLLMVIEKLEAEGIKVASANTDGVEAYCPNKKSRKLFEKIINKQGIKANLGWEFGEYDSLHARDVNNYVAKYDDHVKAKGVYAPRPKNPNKGGWLDLNVQTDICFTAVRQFIQDGTPLKQTIDECKDITQFVSAQTVNGGAVFGTPIFGKSISVVGKTGKTRSVKVVADWEEGSQYLGKVVRYYYAKNGGSIHRKNNGNLVALTDGCKPMMDLTEKIPKDLNYQWYYDYAQKMLDNLGA